MKTFGYWCFGLNLFGFVFYTYLWAVEPTFVKVFIMFMLLVGAGCARQNIKFLQEKEKKKYFS